MTLLPLVIPPGYREQRAKRRSQEAIESGWEALVKEVGYRFTVLRRDTCDIAQELKIREATVYRALSEFRERMFAERNVQ